MVFCDWLSMYQVHWQGCPVVNSGHLFSVDQDGEIEWDINKKVTHQGSFSTKVTISSDGHRVSISGNLGRFNRRDNVFNYSVQECFTIADQILASFGLPPFTDAAPMPIIRKGGSKDYFKRETDAGFSAVGAVVTRVDLTQNYLAGSPGNASQVIRKMQGYKSGKFEPGSYGSSGVDWGKGSKYTYQKLYDKATDYIRHYGKNHKHHDGDLYTYIKDAGMVRHEIELKSRYLRQNNLWRPSHWIQGMADKIYALFTDPLQQAASVDEYLEIPGRAGELAVAWRDGADLRKRLAQNTYYRYRRELLAYGIDIAIPANITRLKTHIEIIQLTPVAPPAWYDLPKVA
jgi:Phage X family/Phage replication protein CRI